MNHCQRTYGPTLSDTFSSDVLHSILSSPTDTLQALNEAVQLDDAKIRNNTQSTKKKIRKFYNGDFIIDFDGSFAQIRIDLRKLFSMGREGATDYVIYDTPNGRMVFRLADHNANGNNFGQDDADVNISVYVAIREFNVPSTTIPFTEFRIKEEVFNNDKEAVVRSIIDAVANALNGEEFSIPPAYADRRDYPINTIGDTTTQTTINNDDKQLNCNRNMKQTIRLTERELRSMVKEAVNEVVRRPRPNTTTLAESKLWNMIQETVEESLNEMDPRTYTRASKKAEEQGDYERAKRFRMAGVDAWNRDWGRDDEEDMTPDNPNPFMAYPTIRRKRLMHDDNSVMDCETYDYHDGEYPMARYKYFNPKDTDKIYKRGGKKVAQQMAQGTGTYIKGKGWQ